VLPGDLVEEGLATCVEVAQKSDAKDPDRARKGVIDAFGSIGVNPTMLKEYVGHPLEQLVPAELQDLRDLFAAIRDGESKWADAMELAHPTTGGEKPVAPPSPAKVEKVKAEKKPEPKAEDEDGEVLYDAKKKKKSEPAPEVVPEYDPVTGEVQDEAGGPDAFTDGLLAKMRAATELNALMALAREAQNAPQDRILEVNEFYKKRREELRPKGGA
jgi:hypothetical protein